MKHKLRIGLFAVALFLFTFAAKAQNTITITYKTAGTAYTFPGGWPSGLTANVEVWGAGAGGGWFSGNSQAGGGGGGACSWQYGYLLPTSTSVNVYVGLGGSSPSRAGEASHFDYIIAHGGPSSAYRTV